MKIAVVRGPSLNQFEMQYYEPLAQRHEVVCFTSTSPVYDVSRVNLSIVKLPCLGQVLGGFPGVIKGLFLAFGDPQGLIGLQKKLAGFDIVHTAELFSYYTHQALKAKKKGQVKKVVATVSENIPFNQEWYRKQKRLKEFALENLDHILAISGLSKKALVIEGYPEEKITVVPHGLDLKRFKPGQKDEKLARKMGIKKDDQVILSVGRLVWEKGFFDLLLAADLLPDENLKFLIVGEGPEKEKLVRWRERLGLRKRVIFGKSLPYNQMTKIYNLADVFVLASLATPIWQEQFGMVLIEAMACGLPVVATRSGGIPETVGKEGILIEPGNSGQLAMAIGKLLKSRQLRSKLAKEGRKRVEKKFERLIVSQKMEAVYEKAREA